MGTTHLHVLQLPFHWLARDPVIVARSGYPRGGRESVTMCRMQKLRPMALIAVGVTLMAVGAGCTDSSKTSERKAIEHADRLAKLADDDVDEVRRGLPRGAQALGQLWDTPADPKADPWAVWHALDRVRDHDRDLTVAKSTFFALTDDKGVVIRSDQDPDILEGKSLTGAYPETAKVLSGASVETVGSMPENAGARTGSDDQWVAAAPVRDRNSVVRGMYATGWSFTRFAYHLEETLKHDFMDKALKGQFKIPLVYVFVFVGPKVYGAPVTPLVDAQALEALDLPSKTADGTTLHQRLEVAGRTYGLAAKRAPKLGQSAGVAVLRSEI
jgi:hypothetical protein